jgi:peptidoglycan hydrolase-like protein with peptidoglycan-binding domain
MLTSQSGTGSNNGVKMWKTAFRPILAVGIVLVYVNSADAAGDCADGQTERACNKIDGCKWKRSWLQPWKNTCQWDADGKKIQKRLGVPQTGVRDKRTIEAIKRHQRKMGLPPTGTLDSRTRKTLE